MPLLRSPRLRALAALAAAGTAAALIPILSPAVATATTSTSGASFTFGAGGDMDGFNTGSHASGATATLGNLHSSGAQFFLHLGDFDYGSAPIGGPPNGPQTWCDTVHRAVGSSFPYEIVSGGHDNNAPTSVDGPLADFTACMPDQLGSTVAPNSAYGQDYYFDYPAGAPLARVFMLAAGERLDSGQVDDYSAGSPNYNWVSAAIDSARADNIPWVIVGTAWNCVTAGEKTCNDTSHKDGIGSDLFNLFISKKVNLVLQGHEHGYERSKQFSPSCTVPKAGPATAIVPMAPVSCMTAPTSTGGTDTYPNAGNGPVVIISGTLGVGERTMWPEQPAAADFVKIMGGTADAATGQPACSTGDYNGNPGFGTPASSPLVPCDPSGTHGFVKYTVTPTQISGTFVSDNDPLPGTSAFSDSFTIAGGTGTVGTPTQTTATSPPSSSGPPPPHTGATPPAGSGYWALDSAGDVYGFGSAVSYGNDPAGNAVHIEPTPTGRGYWLLSADGAVSPHGDATSFGNANLMANEQAVSLSATPSGRGYWVFTNLGRAVALGDAHWYGDMSGKALNGAVLGSVATPDGGGYWMVASDGGIFSFGDASFYGSMGGRTLNKPVMSMAPTADNRGYWLVASDGGIFAFGDAPFKGSMGGTPLNKPVSGMVPENGGYLMVAQDGGIFAFGIPFHGSLGGNPPATPVVSVAALP